MQQTQLSYCFILIDFYIMSLTIKKTPYWWALWLLSTSVNLISRRCQNLSFHLKSETQKDNHLKIAQSAQLVNCAIRFQEAEKTKRERGERRTKFISRLPANLLRSHHLKPGQCLPVQGTAWIFYLFALGVRFWWEYLNQSPLPTHPSGEVNQ